mgnify:CR=1 FL=1
MKLLQEFQDFLKEYKIVSLALAFIIGTASTSLVRSLVDNIIMPFVSPLVPSSTWEQATFALGPVVIEWGAFLSELISFVILAFVVFIIAKKLFETEVKK